MTKMNQKFHFLIQSAKSNRAVGVEVFSNWILGTLRDLTKSSEESISLDQLKSQLADQQRLDFNISVRTRQLFEDSLNYLIEGGLIRQQEASKALIEPMFALTLFGRRRIDDLVGEQERLNKRSKQDFLEIMYGEIAKTIGGVEFDNLRAELERLLPSDNGVQESIERAIEYVASVRSFERIFSNVNLKVLANEQNASSIGIFQRSDLRKHVFLRPDHHLNKAELINKAFLDSVSYLLDNHLVLGEFPGLEYAFWLNNYESLYRWLLPDEKLQEKIRDYLECIYVYLDTNILVAALCDNDPLHRKAQTLIRLLSKSKVNYFWLNPTDKEFKAHLDFAHRAVKKIDEVFPTKYDVRRFLETVSVPSFVKDYYLGDWRNWNVFQDAVLANYSSLLAQTKARDILNILRGDSLFREIHTSLKGTMQNILETTAKTKFRTNLVKDHDADVLAFVQALRSITPKGLLSDACEEIRRQKNSLVNEFFWFVSFDRELFDIAYQAMETENQSQVRGVKVENEPSEKLPLVLLYDTIFIFMDPFVVSQDFFGLEEIKVTHLRPLGKIKDLQAAFDETFENMQIVNSLRETLDTLNISMLSQNSQTDIFEEL